MFTQYYTEKHTGRKLTINTLLGNADVKATFYPPVKASPSSDENGPGPSSSSDVKPDRKPDTKILQVNTHQMIILLQFNHRTRISCQQLMDELKIPERELKRNLQSLALGKASQRILVRKTKGKDAVGENQSYSEPVLNHSLLFQISATNFPSMTTSNRS